MRLSTKWAVVGFVCNIATVFLLLKRKKPRMPLLNIPEEEYAKLDRYMIYPGAIMPDTVPKPWRR